MKRTMWGVLLAAASVSCGAARRQAGNLVSDTRWGLRSFAGGGTMERFTAADLPGGHASAIRLTVTAPADPFYLIMIAQEFDQDIPIGTRLRLALWARSATRNPIRALVEKASAPWTPVAVLTPTLTPDWRRYTITGTTAAAFGPRGLGVRVQFGHQKGGLEVAGITVENLGLDPAIAEAQAALAPEAMAARIRQHRMGDMKVVVRDRAGRPVTGAAVRVEQTRHEFLFGCNIFALDPSNSDQWQLDYQRQYLALFNYATLPFYWGGFEPRRGEPDYARLDAMARWCKDHGLLTKGHPLVWHEVWPGWAPQTADESKPLLRQRIADIIPRYKGLVQYWDVQNEANNSADYPKTGVGDWARRDGPAAMVRQTLAWAREASKGAGAILLYNDFNTTELNVKLLEDLRGLGALPDVIGIQSHMHSGPWQDVEVWRVCRRFGQFGLPIHFTETTIVSGPQQATDPRDPPAGWQSTPEGEAAQAAAVERLYRILFSHPSVSAVTWWDFADRNAWMGAPAGLLRKDMTPKPAYQRLVEMVRREWWTRANARTSRSGTASVRAFLGDHKIVVTAPNGANVERNVRLTRRTGKAGLTVTVTLP